MVSVVAFLGTSYKLFLNVWSNTGICYVSFLQILGTGMSTKMWEVTVEHARTCVLDKKIYLFCPRSQEKTGVVFNVVGQLMGLLSDCQYVPTDRLSETEKVQSSYDSNCLPL